MKMRRLCIGSIRRTLLFLSMIFTITRQIMCFKFGDDTLTQGDYFEQGSVLTSASGLYNLQYLTIGVGAFTTVYLGIYHPHGCLWLANLNNPMLRETPKLAIDDYGSFKVLYNNETEFMVLYSSHATHKINVSATLLDTGNFVLREIKVENGTVKVKQVLWESFDHPQYILLPGMKLGFNNRTGKNWTLTSWVGPNTPVKGSFTLGLDPNDNEQLVIMWKGNPYWTSGPLTNETFPNLASFFTLVKNENETYFIFDDHYSPLVSDFIGLDAQGQLYGTVSVSCSSYNPTRVSGCVPQSFPTCRDQHAYVSMLNFMYSNVTQEGSYKLLNGFSNISLYDCGVMCMNDCSCVAYTFSTNDKAGCWMWYPGTNFLTSSTGQQVYFMDKINTTDVSQVPGKSKGITRKLRIMLTSVIVGTLLVLVLVSFFMSHVLRRKRKIKEEEMLKQKMILCEIATPSPVNRKHRRSNKIKITNHGMHMFNFEIIELATDHFSLANKLGEGGFGTVYKGQLLDGQEIAIKRLSRSSRQGIAEFKNEIKLIAKFQHTNLVKLYGFCIDTEERMLIYEYMPNKSLDFHLFDSSKHTLMDWMRRFVIIQGIAQGLVYLHTYSRLTVIHRDLKPSNILLDYEMNPKISDFGLARIFESKEPKKNTNKVVGTYGYMSPEYALNGIVSTKIDVFSFGVLMLEIISGKKNSSNYDSDHPINLIGHAWQLWNKDNALELIDPILKGSCVVNEVLRCIHISLLCVQDRADDRPTMSNVVSFLSSEAMLLVEPKQPTFFTNIGLNEPRNPIVGEKIHSINNVTISTMSGR